MSKAIKSVRAPGWLLGIALVALLAAGCGSSSSSSSSSAASGAAATSAAATSAGTQSSSASVPFTPVAPGLPVGYPKPTPKHLVIGYSTPNTDVEDLVMLSQAIKDEAQKLGGKAIVISANNSVSKQVNDLEQLINQHVNALLLFPLDPNSVGPPLRIAAAHHIPVISVDINLTQPNGNLLGANSQVWRRKSQVAYLAAKYMASKLPAGSQVATMGFAVPVPSITYYVDRMKYWAEKFGLKVVGNVDNQTDDITGGAKAMSAILGRFPDIKGLLAYNDVSAIGAQTVARQQGKTGIVLVGANGGTDAVAAIKDGKESASIQLPNVSTGADMVDGAYDMVEGKKVPP
ncbi:MAG: sugar ABC transporter substrate-binding protein, partial [Trebonia sp.]